MRDRHVTGSGATVLCAQPPSPRDQPVPAAARPQPRGLVSVGRGGAGAGARPRPADPAVDRLLRVPLVPRHGTRVVRGRRHRARDERALRPGEDRPRGTARPRRGLHAGGRPPDRPRRLADDGVRDARGRAVLGRHLLPARAAARDAVVPAGARGRRRGVPRAARRGRPCGRPAGAALGRRRSCAPAATGASTRASSTDALRRPARAASTSGTAASAARRSSRRRRRSRSCCACTATGSAEACAWPRPTLDRMAAGGIHDQVGGGFHRYAVDAIWLVPHFEKMLYDNALLARAYCRPRALTGSAAYRQVAAATLDYLRRELRLDARRLRLRPGRRHGRPRGADVHLDAGGAARGARRRAALVEALFGVTAAGNFEGRTVLSRVLSPEEAAERSGVAADRLRVLLRGCTRPATGGRSRPATTRRSPPGTGWRWRPSPQAGRLARPARVRRASRVGCAEFLLGTAVGAGRRPAAGPTAPGGARSPGSSTTTPRSPTG